MSTTSDQDTGLKRSLRQRHMTMISLLIAVAELRTRRRLEAAAPERLKLRMGLFPWLTYLAIAAMVAVIVAMALVEDVRSQLIPSFISLAVVLVAGWLRYRQAGVRAKVGGTQPSRT